jgi:hypothetical protein
MNLVIWRRGESFSSSRRRLGASWVVELLNRRALAVDGRAAASKVLLSEGGLSLSRGADGI